MERKWLHRAEGSFLNHELFESHLHPPTSLGFCFRSNAHWRNLHQQPCLFQTHSLFCFLTRRSWPCLQHFSYPFRIYSSRDAFQLLGQHYKWALLLSSFLHLLSKPECALHHSAGRYSTLDCPVPCVCAHWIVLHPVCVHTGFPCVLCMCTCTHQCILVWAAMTKKKPSTGWFLNYRNVFLTFLDSGKSKIRVVADSASVHFP